MAGSLQLLPCCVARSETFRIVKGGATTTWFGGRLPDWTRSIWECWSVLSLRQGTGLGRMILTNLCPNRTAIALP